jgi:hypothetical protein
MSTSPDDIFFALSRWLAGHLGNAALRRELETVDRGNLATEQAEAVDELLAELDQAGANRRGQLERTVRETLEALAAG